MRIRQFLLYAAFTALATRGPALAGTVTVWLDTSGASATVQPGDVVRWDLRFQVSQGDNSGLALIAVDLVQSAENPDVVEVLADPNMPLALRALSAPEGISNVGPAGNSRFRGTRVPVGCGSNLLQIGGAQNTTGWVGFALGTSTNVETGIGQDPNSNVGELLMSGTIVAPATRGTYVVSLRDPIANVLDTDQPTPTRWHVSKAQVFVPPSGDAVTIVVCPGDATGDGQIDISDLGIVLTAFGTNAGESGYNAAADLNRDGAVNISDLGIVIQNFGNSCANGG